MSVVHNQLRMGNLPPFMTEQSVMSAFHQNGVWPLSVHLMRNKYTNESAGFCLVTFQTGEQAINAMSKLNGKPIPGTQPRILFWLINAKEQVPVNVNAQQQQYYLQQYQQQQQKLLKLKQEQEKQETLELKLKQQQLLLEQQQKELYKLHQQLLLHQEEEFFLQQQQQEEDEELIDYNSVLDVDKMNREYSERDRNLWDALESSKWQPCEMLEDFGRTNMDAFGRDGWKLIAFQKAQNRRTNEDGTKRIRAGVRASICLRRNILKQLAGYSASEDVWEELDDAIKFTNRMGKVNKKLTKDRKNTQALPSAIEEERPQSPDINIKIKNINEKIYIQMKIIQSTKNELETHKTQCTEETEPKINIGKVVSQIEKDLPHITNERNSFQLNATQISNKLNAIKTARNPFKFNVSQIQDLKNEGESITIKKEIEYKDEHNRKNDTQSWPLPVSKKRRKCRVRRKKSGNLNVEEPVPQKKFLLNFGESGSNKKFHVSDVYSDSDD